MPLLPRSNRLRVEIHLSNETPGCVGTYTTGDRIQGTVTITADHDIPFEDISISLRGSSKTAMERVSSIRGVKRARHNFLQLDQPIHNANLLSPRIFQAGCLYVFPFTFSIPGSLVPQSCFHPTASPLVQRSHLLLPPTLGDAMVTSEGRNLPDDMCPDACQIVYLIQVSITDSSDIPTDSPKTLALVGKKLRILPAFDEQPPLNIAEDDEYYRFHTVSYVKRGLLREKVGRLEVTASQPIALKLPRPGSSSDDAEISTKTTMALRFTPEGDEKPPQLENLSIKLKACTFFAANYWSNTPTNPHGLVLPPSDEAVYTKTVPVLSSSVSSVQWTPVPDEKMSCRDSRTSTESTAATAKTYYTASITAPIILPRHKTYVPTFHSCLISRVYSLDLKLSYHAPNTHLLSESTSLRLPLQICSPYSATEHTGVTVSLALENMKDEYPLNSIDFPPQHVRYFEPIIVSLTPSEHSGASTAAITGDN
ncbi:S-antigen [Aspergillus affinis]|uniref:S-antigen n=1 Tax=Aspergillus affinis TaxID=1070780 RepID=UPI0022FE6470|nr:S-antigen [Aspergillus affinis]KAI9041017.1 S-antigen [Aspergillus affinis]